MEGGTQCAANSILYLKMGSLVLAGGLYRHLSIYRPLAGHYTERNFVMAAVRHGRHPGSDTTQVYARRLRAPTRSSEENE
jgi:hypothetical protein